MTRKGQSVNSFSIKGRDRPSVAARQPRERRADENRRQRNRRIEQHEKRGGGERAEHDRIAPAEMIGEPAAKRAESEGAHSDAGHRERVALPREINRQNPY